MTNRPRWPDRPGEGARVLVVADERDLVVRAHLRTHAPALAAAGYRLTFVAASGGGLVGAVARKLREGAYGLIHAHGAWPTEAASLAGLTAATPMLVSLHEVPAVRGLRRWLLGRALGAATVVVPGDAEREAVLRLFPNLRRRPEGVAVGSGLVELYDRLTAAVEPWHRRPACAS